MARQTKNRDQTVSAEPLDDIARKVARRLQEERVRVGLSQTALAELAGVSQNYIYELEYGTTNLTIRTLEQICTALKIDIRDCFPGSSTTEPSNSDLRRLSRTLDELVQLVRQHMADELELIEREVQRRAKDKASLLGELKSITQLCETVGKMVEARKKSEHQQ